MFNPALCIYEVYKLAEEHRKTDYPSCDVGTAFSMFFADVKLGQSTDGNTGGMLPEFDFAEAKSAWDSMTEDEQSVALEEARVSRTACYNELTAAYPDKAVMIKIVEDYLETYRAEKAEEDPEAVE